MPPKKIEEQFHRLTLEPVQDVWHHQTCRWAIWYLCNCHPPTFVSSHAMKPYPFLLPEMIPAEHHLQATIGSSPTKYFLNNRISRTSERLKVLARSWLTSKCPRTLDSNLAWTPHHSQQEDLRIQHPGTSILSNGKSKSHEVPQKRLGPDTTPAWEALKSSTSHRVLQQPRTPLVGRTVARCQAPFVDANPSGSADLGTKRQTNGVSIPNAQVQSNHWIWPQN